MLSQIKTIKDKEFIKSFIKDDKELYNRLSDDYTDFSIFDPSTQDWFGWFDNETCKALLSAHKETECVMIIHIHIPKKHRGKDSFKMGNGLLSYLEKTCPKRFIKINAKIPEIYQDVIKFAIKNGFDIEGIDKMSYVKDKNVYNRIILGKEIKR